MGSVGEPMKRALFLRDGLPSATIVKHLKTLRCLVVLCSAIVLFAAFLNLPLASASLFKIDFDQRYLHEPGWSIRDFALIKADSVYHAFYTRLPDYFQGAMAGDSIGHASSLDLKHWTIHPPVLAVQSGTWESGALWAPFVMRKPDGGYIMYYTGVEVNCVQQIGIATSDDLFNWTRYANNPVFRPDTSWSAWDSGGTCLGAWSSCRDPHVYYEDGTYYMFVTAQTKSGCGAVGSAVSTDMFNWTDTGPIYVHSGAYAWHSIESCFILKRDNKYRMFFSEEESPPGVSYMASDSLFSGWDIGTRRIIDSGIAAEVLEDSTCELFSRFGRFMKGDTVNSAVKTDTLRWPGDIPSAAGPHPLNEKWAEVSGDAFFYQPTFGDNSWERGSQHSGFQGNSWLGTVEYFQGPLQGGWSGWALGEDATGYAKSYPFTVQGDSISLLVGGGYYPGSAFVGLYRASDDSLLFSETGKNTDTMDRRIWFVRPLKGQSAYVKIVDGATGNFGHINCDEIVEISTPPDTLPPWVNLFEPSGGETLMSNQQFEIRWKAGDNETAIDSVVIDCSLDGGFTYPYLIARPAPQDTSFLWTIPDANYDSCLIRVTAYDWGPNSASDQSDSLFRIANHIGIIEDPSSGKESRLSLSVQGQNPFASRTSLSFSLPVSLGRERYSLDVFDISGRHVRTLARGTCPAAGTSVRVSWDSLDEAGTPVSSGVYLVLLRVNDKPILNKKVVLLR